MKTRTHTNGSTEGRMSRPMRFGHAAVSAIALGTLLWITAARAEVQTLSGGEQSVLDQEKTEIKATGLSLDQGPLPTLSGKPFPVAKAKFHRLTNLRAGAFKSAKGFIPADWAWQAVNLNGKTLEITWKLISDDPNFVYNNGDKGTCTKLMKASAMNMVNGNVLDNTGGGNWPVPLKSTWTGSAEWSASEPFYLYVFAQMPSVEGPDAQRALYKSWLLFTDEVGCLWDKELKQTVVPYVNYWHNIGTWCGGWHSRLIIANHFDKKVTYRVEYRIGYGFTNPFLGPKLMSSDTIKNVYQNQRAMIKLAPGEKFDMYLEDLYGWQKDWCSRMEGFVLITPDIVEAGEKTEVRCWQVANKVTVDAPWGGNWGNTLKEKERNELSDEAGILLQPASGNLPK